jgi:antitoxin component YwqK of YwqJK toxin-antitoxin module
MPLPLKPISLGTLLVVLASCHNTPTPQQAPQPQIEAPAPEYATGGPDTSVTKAGIDPKAKEGLNEIHYKSGMLKAKGYYKGGKKEGEWQSFYENGKLWSDEFFTAGVRDGKVTVWYDNGQKMYEGSYKEGKPDGVWSRWNDNGQLQRTSDYNKKSSNTAL